MSQNHSESQALKFIEPSSHRIFDLQILRVIWSGGFQIFKKMESFCPTEPKAPVEV